MNLYPIGEKIADDILTDYAKFLSFFLKKKNYDYHYYIITYTRLHH